ncbi:MAG: response regulator transcription factor [Hyphomicrobium sp.]|nr:response regulator transcription factor [Hyphomicrobium sp.]
MREAKKILVVDDDPQVRDLLRDILEAEGYQVTPASGRAAMLQAIAGEVFDLITLDLGLAGVCGVELVRELCLSTETPVIIVSGRNDDYDRVVTLELGADDYILKPFNTRELSARVRAVLRRCAKATRRIAESRISAASVVTFHDYQLNTQTRKLSHISGAMVALTSAECRLLEVLIENSGRACTRDEITSRIKGRAWSPLDRSLDTLVARLRRKIEPDPGQPALLMSVRGIGYMMTVSAGLR